jgi:hypothetical protein
MPCRDYDMPTSGMGMQKRLNKYAAMLCEQCKVLDALDDEEVFTSDVKEWWTKHKAEDAKQAAIARKKAEEERQKKLAIYLKLKEELGL